MCPAPARPTKYITLHRALLLQHETTLPVVLWPVVTVYIMRSRATSSWLPNQNQWTLIDFGCSVRSGTICGLSFSLYYAHRR